MMISNVTLPWWEWPCDRRSPAPSPRGSHGSPATSHLIILAHGRINMSMYMAYVIDTSAFDHKGSAFMHLMEQICQHFSMSMMCLDGPGRWALLWPSVWGGRSSTSWSTRAPQSTPSHNATQTITSEEIFGTDLWSIIYTYYITYIYYIFTYSSYR
jgi:hypothetical protein